MHYGIRESRPQFQHRYLLSEGMVSPAPRDDIESLGYSLLHLACGNLPWMYNVWHGTRKTQYDQVRIKKLRYSGADLAPDELP